ncbi:MAG: nucleoside recognition protein, partial [Proteiniphilum sp.]
MQFWNDIVLRALRKSLHTSLWLLKIILPISLLVRFLDYYGMLAYLADFLDPVFVFMGLPG